MTQSFDEWFESMGHMDGYQHHYQDAYDTGCEVGAQSRQSEVDELHLKYSRDSQALHNVIEMEVNKRDELQKRIDDSLQSISETCDVNCNLATDDYHYLIEDLKGILKGKQDEK